VYEFWYLWHTLVKIRSSENITEISTAKSTFAQTSAQTFAMNTFPDAWHPKTLCIIPGCYGCYNNITFQSHFCKSKNHGINSFSLLSLIAAKKILFHQGAEEFLKYFHCLVVIYTYSSVSMVEVEQQTLVPLLITWDLFSNTPVAGLCIVLTIDYFQHKKMS
jgi:hypothetical protein